MGHILQEQVVQHQLPGAIAAYNRGLPITFQNLAITSNGILIGNRRHLSWQELDSATVTQTPTRKSIHPFVEIRQKNQQNPWVLLDQTTLINIATQSGRSGAMKRPIVISLAIVSVLSALYYSIPADAAKHKILNPEFNDVVTQQTGG